MKSFLLLRHGESVWNKINKFTGWTNIQLTEHGCNQAYNVGKLLRNYNINPTIIFSSELNRCIETSKLLRNGLNKDITFKISWRLNEKHYGPCEGLTRNVISNIYGEHFLKNLRKDYYLMPPKVDECTIKNTIYQLPYYDENNLQFGESNEMVEKRLLPYWNNCIIDYINNDRLPIIVTHKHPARVLIKYLSNMTHEDFNNFDINNAVIYKINLNNNFKIDNINTDIIKID